MNAWTLGTYMCSVLNPGNTNIIITEPLPSRSSQSEGKEINNCYRVLSAGLIFNVCSGHKVGVMELWVPVLWSTWPSLCHICYVDPDDERPLAMHFMGCMKFALAFLNGLYFCMSARQGCLSSLSSQELCGSLIRISFRVKALSSRLGAWQRMKGQRTELYRHLVV